VGEETLTGKRYLARMDPQDADASLRTGRRKFNFPINSPGSEQCRVQNICGNTMSGGNIS
jgi:hypothetical protein